MFSSMVDSLYGGINGGGNSTLSKFGDPFMLPSWSIMPEDIRSLFDICRFLYVRTPEIAEANARIVAYFITEVEFIGDKAGSKEEQEEMSNWLRWDLGLWFHQMEMGMDEGCYGNAFSRIHRPFYRFLLIPTERGMAEVSVNEFPDAQYNHTTVKYTIQDPTRAHRSGKHRRSINVDFVDRVSQDLKRMTLRRIDPAFAYLQHAERTGRTQVVERFRPEFKSAIRRGDLWQVNETPLPMLKAIAVDGDFLYNEGEVFHLKAPFISGISNAGWGFPKILANFPNIHQMQVYKRIDESVALDYMLPLRIFFPTSGSSGTLDAFANQGAMSVWKEMLQRMITNRRQDPLANMAAMPFPMGYQEVGANGKSLAPKESMDWQQNAMLNAMGYPAELYGGSLSYQQVPTALRLFENHKQFLPWGFNKHLQWVVRTALDFTGRERMNCRLTSPRILDDIESRQVYLQLAAGGEFPRSKAYQAFGITDAVQAAVDRAHEDASIQKKVLKVQEDAALEVSQGQMFSGGGAGGAPSGVGVTPTQRSQQASSEAQRLLQIPNDGDRQKELMRLKQTDGDFHAIVKQKMDEMRAAARSAGGQQVAQMAAA